MTQRRSGGTGSAPEGGWPEFRWARKAAAIALTGCLVVAAGAVAFFDVDEHPDSSGAEAIPDGRVGETSSAPPADISTALWFGTTQTRDEAQGVSWLVVLALNHSNGRAAVVYLPAHTAGEVPGRGLRAVADAFVSGGAPLLLMGAENLVGVPLDDRVEMSARGARALFSSLGPLRVDVPGEVRRAGGELLFSPGPQRLGARWLTRLLFTSGAGGDDIELGPRHLAVWESMLGRIRALGDRGRHSILEGTLSGPRASGQIRLLRAIAAVGRDDLTLASIPVSELSTGGEELYSPHSEALTALLEGALGTRRLHDEVVRVQVLNGNGVPGVGARVAKRLIGNGYQIALSGNASRLDYPRTLIVAYDRSQRGRRYAARARRLLGIGEVQVAAQPQGIVDLTIVVGKDFSQRRAQHT